MLTINNISKKVGQFELSGINENVCKGDYFMLLGESGAGKSLLLELISGLSIPDKGEIFLNGKNLLETSPGNNGVGIVFQKPSLFPHMSVFENIAFPLKGRRRNKKEIYARVVKLADDMDISSLLNRNITNLSGGEIQRVTIARTLATDPELLLLDEPLSSLDMQLKRELSALLRKINRSGITIIHVTHDYDETLTLAGRVAIMEKGKIIQSGQPVEIFKNPASLFVANFVGIKNFFKGRLVADEDDKNKIFISDNLKIKTCTDEKPGREGFLSIHGNSIFISTAKPDSSVENAFPGTIKDIFNTREGKEVIIAAGIDISAEITTGIFNDLKLLQGMNVWLSFPAKSAIFHSI